jgi:hypothetical protein
MSLLPMRGGISDVLAPMYSIRPSNKRYLRQRAQQGVVAASTGDRGRRAAPSVGCPGAGDPNDLPQSPFITNDAVRDLLFRSRRDPSVANSCRPETFCRATHCRNPQNEIRVLASVGVRYVAGRLPIVVIPFAPLGVSRDMHPKARAGAQLPREVDFDL